MCRGSLLTKAQLCDGLYTANAVDKRRKLVFRSASGMAKYKIKRLEIRAFPGLINFAISNPDTQFA